MSDLTIRHVQQVNRQRANRWHGGDFKNWSGLEWAGALCGEAGEAANAAKKLRRVELELDGWLYCGGCGGRIGDGSRPPTPTNEEKAMLRNEAQRAISNIRNTARDFKARGAEREAGVLLRQSDVLADIIRKLSNGNAHSEHPLIAAELIEKLAAECADTFLYLTLLASRYDIDLERAVIQKFNQKSEEMGFPERLVRDW